MNRERKPVLGVQIKGLTPSLLLALLAALVALGLLGCGKQENPNDWPVSHWLNDPDPCVRETAAAIVASGKPWPNEVRDEKGKLIRFDFWIGDQFYELPGDTPLIRNGFAPHAHPLRYSSVSGHAETFLGVPRDKWLKFKHPGVGGTLYGNVYCSNNLPPNEWIEARALHAPNRNEAIAMALERSRKADPRRVLRTDVNERSDIQMTEVRSYTNPPELAGASYFPMNRDVAQTINGRRVVKNIGCRPYDPEAKLHVGYLCHSWIYLGPGLWIEFEVYQQMLPIVPDLHDKFLATFEQSRKK
jgi:hypothetical protein